MLHWKSRVVYALTAALVVLSALGACGLTWK